MSNLIKGIGQCLICEVFIDNPEDFTCGNPQCNVELREVLELEEYNKEEIKELFDLLGASSFVEAITEIESLQEQKKDLIETLEECKTLLKNETLRKIQDLIESALAEDE